MAFHLSLLLSCASSDQASSLATLLARETRPEFEDDLSAEEKALFSAIEDLEYPEAIEPQGDQILISWSEIDGMDFDDLEMLLEAPGVALIGAYEVPDDPMAADDDESMSQFWINESGRPRAVSAAKAQEMLPEGVYHRLVGG
ncbi:hypothetical protein [Allohahella sp. A8]|uniref:hypothetical protein n=1 Tax=Allohahella sp. A8 TaxID=3141461 RepID=UPI003A80C639